VRLLYWAAPTLLNPHIALGPNDFEASEIFYEPLADIARTALSCRCSHRGAERR